MSDEEQKYADILRDDFNALKSEIGRRSNLQRYVLAVYVGLLALVMNLVLEETVNFKLLVAVHGTSILTQIYKYREWLEIKRLGLIIKNKIAPKLKILLKLDKHDLVYHSQTDPYIDSLPRIKRRILSLIFNWSVFVTAPFLLSLDFLVNNNCDYLILIISLQAVTFITTLLIEHILDNHKMK